MAGRSGLGEKHDRKITARRSGGRLYAALRDEPMSRPRAQGCRALRTETSLRLGVQAECPVADRVDLGQCDEAVSIAWFIYSGSRQRIPTSAGELGHAR